VGRVRPSPKLMPWDRRRNEPEGEYQAFCMYLRMPIRNVVSLAGRYNVHPIAETFGGVDVQKVEKWYRAWDWENRTLAWDAEQNRMFEEETRAALRLAIETNKKMKVQEVMSAHTLADQVGEKIRFILEWPLDRMVEERRSDDGKYIIKLPQRWTLGDVRGLSDAYIKLRNHAYSLGGMVGQGAGSEVARDQDEVDAALEAMATVKRNKALGFDGGSNGNGHAE
jgi:hypothetical protein